MAEVGRIVFESADGQPVATARYGAHPLLRGRTLLWRGQTYHQNHQIGTQWVYRATEERAGAPESDPALSDVRTLDHPQYDGPPIVVPASETCPTCGQRRRG